MTKLNARPFAFFSAAHAAALSAGILILALTLSVPVLPAFAAEPSAAVGTSSATAEINVFNRKYIKVDKYAVRLDLFPEKHMVSGEVDIFPVPGAEFSGEVVLNLHSDMDVRTLSTYPGGKTPGHRRKDDLITFSCDGPASKISVSFYGDPSRYITPKNSFTYIGKEGCYFDDLCAYFPRAGFGGKSAFELSVTHPENWKPVTQGERAWTLDLRNGRAETRFANVKKSRCHTLAAGPYIRTPAADVGDFEINAFFYARDSEAASAHLSEAAAILNFYRSRYGDDGIKKLNIVEVEKVFPGGYGPEEVVYITAAVVDGKKVDFELLAHEIAHQWFGNFVMGEFPASNFLNEAFATYASMEYTKEKHPGEYQQKYDEMRREYIAYRYHAGTGEVSIDAAARDPRLGYAWQILLYYRGMMVLNATLHLLERAAGMKQHEIISKYLAFFADKTVTVDEFKKFLFDGKSSLYSPAGVRDENALRKAAADFDDFYYATAAVELSVKSAVTGAAANGRSAARLAITRHDGIGRDFEVGVAVYGCAAGDANLADLRIAEKTLVLKRGENMVDFELDAGYGAYKYFIDEENNNLLYYKLPVFTGRGPDTESIAVLGVPEGEPERFGELCRELAGNAGYKVISDGNFDPGDLFKYRDILLIGNFRNSPLKDIFNCAFNIRTGERVITTRNCFNHGSFDFVEGVSAKFTMKNPFIEGGVVNAVLFSGAQALGGYTKLRSGLGDFCFYDSYRKKLKTGCFNQGFSGEFEKNGGVRLIYDGVGTGKTFITRKPVSLLFDIYNSSPATIEALITYTAPGIPAAPETSLLAPGTVTRHESLPMVINDNDITYTAAGNNGDILFSGRIEADARSGNADAVAVGAGGSGEFQKIGSMLNFLYADQFKSRYPPDAVNVNFANSVINPISYEGFKAVILNNYDMASTPEKLADTLKNYAAAGGIVIVSGGGMSGIYSPRTASFIKEIFGAGVSSSKVHIFDASKPGIALKYSQNGIYSLQNAEWKDVVKLQNSEKEGDGEAPRITLTRGDNPVVSFSAAETAAAGGGGTPVTLFGSKLIYRRFGNGAFYYLPYDFSDETLKSSRENIQILKLIFSGGVEPATAGLKKVSPDSILFNPSERPWPFTLQHFIIFMIVYILSHSLIYAYASRRKTGGRYIWLSAAAALLCLAFLAFVLRCFTSFDRATEIIGLTEISDGYYGPVCESGYHKIWPGNVDRLSLTFDGDLIAVNDNGYNYNKIDFSRIPGGYMTETPDPLIFYPVIFSATTLKRGGFRKSPFIINALRPADKKHFIVTVGASVFENLNISGPAVILIKTPGGFFLDTASREKSEYIFGNDCLTYRISVTEDIRKRLGISAAGAECLINLIFEQESRSFNKAEHLLFIISAEDIKLRPRGSYRLKECKKINATVTRLNFTDEKRSVIADFSFKKEKLNFRNDLYTSLSFEPRRFINFAANGGGTQETSLSAVISIKTPADVSEREIERFREHFIKSFADNLTPAFSGSGSAGLKFRAGEAYGRDFINIMHDNNKNFVYNVSGGNLIFKIKNFGHYLIYDLNDPAGRAGFVIRQSAISWRRTIVANFDISVIYE
ncbi:MAG: hypothetical protein A2008_02995 [Candidatus Wallbacteria bacterium GWC2_49_35]|uniref:Peptidase M1 membrane alanine aminopeptidase domain-containing protein n=1 Tax=Candidatus Wallbacteria bacterium GWC2_49_35 TaxID=1817813 RepID=A0A1F7WSK0_9BACT|nr:MAG: hypothetical protein A2008_02995 [Candidatus Wallbacteria bacterium GWC2_49_35]HBC73464.1 hypothetical protein [Candidatus Wallbacteria bacterium]